jgi:pimeloyl-ACP methyl ester carboxylesterase
VIRRLLVAAGLAAVPTAAAGVLLRRGADRLLDAPRVLPEEAALGPDLDALGGEVVRLRSRDGLRLSGRWLPAAAAAGDGWAPDPYEAILLLHGWSGSVAPDVVEFGPFLRNTSGVLALDFRGHGESDPSPTTFGLREVEDVAGALAWLGERGIRRVAIFGTSMGGITALAAAVVLGDGSLPGADAEPDATMAQIEAPRPRIVGIAAESVPPELSNAIRSRLRGPMGALRGPVSRHLFTAAAQRLGGDPRATEPIRVLPLVDVPVLLIQGDADENIPLFDARRLLAVAGGNVEQWVVPGAAHSRAHTTEPREYEERVTAFVRAAMAGARDPEAILPASPARKPARKRARRVVND